MLKDVSREMTLWLVVKSENCIIDPGMVVIRNSTTEYRKKWHRLGSSGIFISLPRSS